MVKKAQGQNLPDDADLLAPLRGVEFIPRGELRPNDYNPNKVNEGNLELLTQSILSNGWTLPIVARPDRTIIDGFHRWTVSGREPLVTRLGGLVPVVTVAHTDKSGDVYGTITHNRARGTHLLEPMKAIVRPGRIWARIASRPRPASTLVAMTSAPIAIESTSAIWASRSGARSALVSTTTGVARLSQASAR